MSLIPSESASFSDLLGRGLDASKKSKWRAPTALDQSPPPPPKVESPAEETAPQDLVEKTPQPERIEAEPMPPPLFLPPASEETKSALEASIPPGAAEETLKPLHPEVTASAPVSASPPPAAIEPISEAASEPTSAPLPPSQSLEPVSSGLTASALLSLLSVQFKAAPESTPQSAATEEIPKAVESELTPIAPLPPATEKTAPAEPLRDIIPDPVVPSSQKFTAEISSLISAQPKQSEAAPAPIPVVPIARPKPAPETRIEPLPSQEASKPQSQTPVRSVVPPPRPPQAKPRLRPRPNLQPRFESDLKPVAPSAVGSPPSASPSVAPAAENGESVTYLEYLAPDISTRTEDFQYTEAAVEWPGARRRGRNKLLRFVSCEIVALVVLAVSVLLLWSHRLGNGSLSFAAKVAAIMSAIAVVVLAILFYGLPEKLPRGER